VPDERLDDVLELRLDVLPDLLLDDELDDLLFELDETLELLFDLFELLVVVVDLLRLVPDDTFELRLDERVLDVFTAFRFDVPELLFVDTFLLLELEVLSFRMLDDVPELLPDDGREPETVLLLLPLPLLFEGGFPLWLLGLLPGFTPVLLLELSPLMGAEPSWCPTDRPLLWLLLGGVVLPLLGWWLWLEPPWCGGGGMYPWCPCE